MPEYTRINDNLLVLLYRLAHRQQENFTTESFAHLLQHLIDREPQAAARVLDWLTDHKSHFSKRNSGGSLAVRTQDYTIENGVPDIRIEADDVDVIVEVKLGDDLTFEQVEAYSKELTRGRGCSVLVVLVGWAPTCALPPGVKVRLWRELGVMLRGEAAALKSDVARYLVEQFAELLNHLQLMPRQVRSSLSKELSDHQQWAQAHPDRPSLFGGRIKSMERLKDMPHTERLKQLLLQMNHVLERASGVKTCRFDSGRNSDEPWIGFNVNEKKYFFVISLDEPEKIYLERYAHDVDPSSFDESCGYLAPSRENGLAQWSDELDLLGPGCAFFGADEVEQQRILATFFERAFAFGERLPTMSQTRV